MLTNERGEFVLEQMMRLFLDLVDPALEGSWPHLIESQSPLADAADLNADDVRRLDVLRRATVGLSMTRVALVTWQTMFARIILKSPKNKPLTARHRRGTKPNMITPHLAPIGINYSVLSYIQARFVLSNLNGSGLEFINTTESDDGVVVAKQRNRTAVPRLMASALPEDHIVQPAAKVNNFAFAPHTRISDMPEARRVEILSFGGVAVDQTFGPFMCSSNLNLLKRQRLVTVEQQRLLRLFAKTNESEIFERVPSATTTFTKIMPTSRDITWSTWSGKKLSDMHIQPSDYDKVVAGLGTPDVAIHSLDMVNVGVMISLGSKMFKMMTILMNHAGATDMFHKTTHMPTTAGIEKALHTICARNFSYVEFLDQVFSDIEMQALQTEETSTWRSIAKFYDIDLPMGPVPRVVDYNFSEVDSKTGEICTTEITATARISTVAPPTMAGVGYHTAMPLATPAFQATPFMLGGTSVMPSSLYRSCLPPSGPVMHPRIQLGLTTQLPATSSSGQQMYFAPMPRQTFPGQQSNLPSPAANGMVSSFPSNFFTTTPNREAIMVPTARTIK